MIKNVLFATLIALCMILAASAIATAQSEPVQAVAGVITNATATEPATVHQVDINVTGFNPEDITIEEGDSVNWTNQTSQTVVLEEGNGSCIYMPVVTKLNQKTSGPNPPGVASMQANGVSILPGESYTRAFMDVGSYHFFLLGHCIQPGMVTVDPRKDFNLTADPDNATIYAGDSVTYTIELAAQNGFNSPVTLSVDGLPAGASGSFNPNPVNSPSNFHITIETTQEHPAEIIALRSVATVAKSPIPHRLRLPSLPCQIWRCRQ